jgi:PadR family transcriptional regulator PadR
LSDEALQVDHGSLYPALNRLLKQRWIAANWEQMPDKNRQARYYRLTPAGRKQLTAEESKWERLAQAIAKVMKRRPEEV